MATWTSAGGFPDTGNTPNASDAFTPALGDLLVVFVTKEESTSLASADLTSSISGNTFTLIRTQTMQPSAAAITGVFVANQFIETGEAISQTVTLGSGSDPGAGSNIGVMRLAGLPAGRVGSTAVRQQGGTDETAGPSTPSASFPGAALTANAVVGGVASAATGITVPSGWNGTDIDVGYTTGQDSALEVAWRNSGETGTTITWGSSEASWSAIVLEINTSALEVTNTDKTTGTIVVSGTVSESYVAPITFTDRRSGLVAVSGTRRESKSHVSKVTGTITITGTRVETTNVLARKFENATSDDLRTAIGACNLTSAATVVALVRKVNDPAVREEFVTTHTAAGVSATGLATGIAPDHEHLLAYGQVHSSAVGDTITFVKNDGWAVVAFTFPGGTNVFGRFHIFKGGAWEHVEAKEVLSNPASQAGGSVRFASISGVGFTDLEIAAAALWTEELSDAEVETLSTNRAIRDWLDLNPAGCWQFNQAVVATDVLDITGNGADQTSVSGTSVLQDGPGGWNYESVTIDRCSGTITISGTLGETYTATTTFTDAVSGQINLSGTRREDYARAERTTGTITITGTLSDTWAQTLTDRRSGQIDVSGTTRESSEQTAETTGTIVISGAIRETYAGATTDNVTGTITLSGTTREESSQTAKTTGTIIVSGTLSDTWALGYTDRVTGTIILSGASREESAQTAESTGTILVSGTTREQYIGAVTDQVSGTINVSGAVREESSQTTRRPGTINVTGTISESWAVSGGSQTHLVSGTITLAGTRRESLSHSNRSAGTVTISGSASDTYGIVNTERVTGTINLTGAIRETYEAATIDRVSGAISLSGTRREDHSEIKRRTGTITVSGTASTQHLGPTTDVVSGIIQLTGTRRESWFWTATDRRTGTVTISGSLREIFIPSGVSIDSPVGTITLSGSALDIHSRWDWVDGERWDHDSDSRWAPDTGERWNVDVVV